MVHQSNTVKKGGNLSNSEQRRLWALAKVQNDEITQHFFNKVGSCFNQLQAPATHTKRIVIRINGQLEPAVLVISAKEIERIFEVTKRLMAKELLDKMDEIALNAYSSGDIVGFPYKSFSETVNLVLTSLIRELMQQASSGVIRFDPIDA